MKKLILSLAFLAFFILALAPLAGGLYAQSTEIKPGLILPKMTTAQRLAVASPVDGMLVFDNTTQTYWYRKSGTWTELPSNASAFNFWQQTGLGGNEIKNTNSGGFWSANPTGLTWDATTNITNPPIAPVNGAGTRLMWIPSRSAFRVGTLQNFDANESTFWNAASIGLFSTAIGFNTLASGDYTAAFGRNTKAIGLSSTAFGFKSTATGYYSTAMGLNSLAQGDNSTAIGFETKALGFSSVAMGDHAFTTNTASAAVAMGRYTEATGIASTAMGYYTNAYGENSTAIGDHAIANGIGSFAAGYNTRANGESTTALGEGTVATYYGSLAIGHYNIENPEAIFMVGTGYNNQRITSFLINYYGSVGIGTENPLAPLHVSTSEQILGSTSGRYFNYGTNVLGNYVGNETTSILADASIVTKTTIAAFQNVAASDSRIKNIVGVSNNSQDLEKLRKLEITDYTMKDVATWGNKAYKKVIAQQVESVYPQAINTQTAVIPDIYMLAQSVSYNIDAKELTVNMAANHALKVGDKLEVVHPERGKIQSTIAAINGNSFTLKDWQHPTDKLFVFGREVSDFRTVDYEALSMLGISAIQQLAKENDKKSITIDELRITISKQEERLSDIETFLKANVPTGK
jgi:Head domain of trimeric autotransporter adhesin/Chaperone of endosialidase